jgi:hypothetical protein
MGDMAVIPAWVTPPADAVEGCHRRAVELAPAHPWVRAVVAALDWVTGADRALAPATGRALAPTEAAVRAEMHVADGMMRFGDRTLPAEVWATFGVPPALVVTGDRDWLAGSAATMGWLLGVHDRPPLRVRQHAISRTSVSSSVDSPAWS